MSKQEFVNPVISPEQAAQEVVLELVSAGFANCPDTGVFAGGRMKGENVSAALIAIHRGLTAYYRSLSAEQ